MPASFYILRADTSAPSIPVGRLIISVCVYIYNPAAVVALPFVCVPSLSCSLLFPT